jgi:hypothetical protein
VAVSVNPRRVAGLLLSLLGIVLLAWVGPAVWWVSQECRAACTVRAGAERLTLPSGLTLQILSKTADGDTANIDYVSENLADEPRLCGEVRELFQRLSAKREFSGMQRVYIMPTDPGARLLGLTWRGPVFSCCRSTGVVFRKAEGAWTVPTGLCKG